MGNILIFFAKWFAIFAHGSVQHKRKYSGEPYHVHLQEVACIVSCVGGTAQQIAAAWLHDTVEDTWVRLWMIRLLFGKIVAGYVDGLTDVSTPDDGNRKKRKALDLIHASQQTPECKTIKLADTLSNTARIVKDDPAFAKVYLKEKADLLKVLGSGNQSLYEAANRIVKQYAN